MDDKINESTKDNQEVKHEEDHDAIHAKMVKMYRMIIIFCSIIMMITAVGVYIATHNLYLFVFLAILAIFVPAFIYKISIKTIREYPLD